MAEQKISVGRIVTYVLPDGKNKGERRPAIVVRVWSETTVNLQVFTDGDGNPENNDGLPSVLWQTSRQHDEENRSPGTWHWPERV